MINYKKRTWTLNEAIEFINELRKELLPLYQLGLTGSVLYAGQSTKDLDLIVYPTSTESFNYQDLHQKLANFGLHQLYDYEFVKEKWAEQGSNDSKFVEVWRRELKRIDFFFLS